MMASIHMLAGALMGLVQSNHELFNKYVNFDVSRCWIESLYLRLEFTCWTATTTRSVIAHCLWIEVKSQFLHGISEKVLLYNIPNKLNADQKPSIFLRLTISRLQHKEKNTFPALIPVRI